MVDGVCMWYQWWKCRQMLENSILSPLAQRCICWGEKSPRTLSLTSISIIRACDLTGSLFTQALPRLQDNKLHHVWLVSEFSGLERSICIGCCCVVTPVCLTTVAQALRRQKPTVAGGLGYSVNIPNMDIMFAILNLILKFRLMFWRSSIPCLQGAARPMLHFTRPASRCALFTVNFKIHSVMVWCRASFSVLSPILYHLA